jgi:hypothetical protein
MADHLHLAAVTHEDGWVRLYQSYNGETFEPTPLSEAAASGISAAELYRGMDGDTLHLRLVDGDGATSHIESMDGGETWAAGAISGLPAVAEEKSSTVFTGERWFTAHALPDETIRLYESFNGDDWSEVSTIAAGAAGPKLLSPHDSLLAVVYNEGGDLKAKTSDGGSVWSAAVDVEAAAGEVSATAMVNSQKWLVVRADDAAPVASRSLDGGESFELGGEG